MVFYHEIVTKSRQIAKLSKEIIISYFILEILFRNTNRIKTFLLKSQVSIHFLTLPSIKEILTLSELSEVL